MPADALAQLKGNATYYHNKFHGRLTSDGSVYHKDSLTCAHKTLPFGTVLRVVNRRNGKEVVVTVNDRGPFRPNTIIDLSLAAAKELDMLKAGVVPVLAYELTEEEQELLRRRQEVMEFPRKDIDELLKNRLMLPKSWTSMRCRWSLPARTLAFAGR